MKKVNGIQPMKLKCTVCLKVSDVRVEIDGMYVVVKFSGCDHVLVIRDAKWKKH